MTKMDVTPEMKKKLVEHIGRTEARHFSRVSAVDLKQAICCFNIPIEDIPISYWESIKKCYCLNDNGNETFNRLSVGIVCDILKKMYSAEHKNRVFGTSNFNVESV